MENSEHIQEIVKRLKSLSSGQQRQVLDYILELSGETPKGISGKELLRLVGANFTRKQKILEILSFLGEQAD